ncbi:efflux RND transporter periplasmic adaptor subunit [Hymenobacter sp. HDW8]|uniref:efflux RND transporter periplasmic adaptor subunit n=1 Tax=Hymenobacter sp. HDW8 TaxID=2714932 RepID=UPI00140B960A|nr:efflux RND transporter periplasmic adaptor subunit [Hymenobacter sp. HDW8]QIL74800.1 efflux RND transporter periplasmic adaptor subunit [Hymenobacter sp. HDW8]
MKWNLVRLLPFVIGSVAATACGAKKEEAAQNAAPAAVPVTVYKVTEESVVGIDTYPGTVVPLQEVELRAEVSGYLTKSYVQDGQRVTKGQRLYEIDQSRYAAAYQSAQAQLRITQANYEKAAKDAERYNRLAEQDAIARQRVDYATTDVANARAQISAAQASLANAATDLRRSVIIAPFNGTIGLAQVKLGSLVTPGTTLLNTISSDNPIAVDFPVNEQLIPRFAKFQRPSGGNSDSLFTLILGGEEVYPAPGKINTIDRAVNPQTGTITVRLQFPNADRTLRAGMNATVRVLNEDTGRQIVIPNKAVTEQMGEFFVYVVGDSSKVNQRKVLTGTRLKDKIVVRKGLKADEVIVSEGMQNLREGAVVKIDEPTAPVAQGTPAK